MRILMLRHRFDSRLIFAAVLLCSLISQPFAACNPSAPLHAADALATDADLVKSDHAVVEALLRLPEGTLESHPEQREAVLRYLSRHVGTGQYISVAKRLGVLEQTDELVAMLQATPFDNLGVEAAKLLLKAKAFPAIEKTLAQENVEQAASAATSLGYAWHPRTFEMLKSIVEDLTRNRQLRIAAAGALGKQKAGQQFLLELAKSERVAEDIQFVVSDSLLGSSDAAIKKQAQEYIAAVSTATSEPIPPLGELVRMRGDGTAGKVVFNTIGTCIKCHKVAGEGKEIGPDLSEIGSKLSREDLYVAILNPSAAVSHNYETYALLDADDRVITGLLMNRTDESVTVRNSEGIDYVVPTEDIVTLKQQSVSLMPADLQKAMSLQDLLDLVDYLVLLRKGGEVPFHVLASGEPQPDSRDPSTAVDGFEIADGVQVELFAAEPMLLSPTSIDVDSQGRVWVCEAVNYRHFRNPNNEERSEGDRILVLEDTDGDGQADKRTVFYQGTEIDSPHGVTVLGDRVIVSAGENVFVFHDKDGDLKADSFDKLFTGISGVQHDHGIHAFGIGPDGKLYFNFGNEGKQLKSATGETIVDKAGNVVNDSLAPYQQGMVFRCNLDGSELETLGWNFRNNWEVCVDSFGSMWQSDNDDDGNRGTRINFVMEFGNYGYCDQRTGAAWREPRIGLEEEVPLQHWHLNDPGVVPNILQTGAGSPTGMCFYEGDLLPEPFRNQMIHTDPGPNVVRAYPVEDQGAGYQASILNLVKGVRDPWFRPVDVCAAPDGSLFVADWYDPGVGGHRMGDSKHGRIFRITPEGHAGYKLPELDLSSAAGAVAALQSPNLATQFLAQQKLQELGTAAVAELQRVVETTPSDRMRARLLWQLATVSGQPEAQVATAIESANADLRIMGLRLARQHDCDVLSVVAKLSKDASPQVRRECAIALRDREDARAIELWVDLAMQHDGQDRWYLEALGIGADGNWDALFTAWLARVGDDWNTPEGRDLVWRCRSPLACEYLVKLIQAAGTEAEQYRYFRAFDFHEGSPKIKALSALVATRE